MEWVESVEAIPTGIVQHLQGDVAMMFCHDLHRALL